MGWCEKKLFELPSHKKVFNVMLWENIVQVKASIYIVEISEKKTERVNEQILWNLISSITNCYYDFFHRQRFDHTGKYFQNLLFPPHPILLFFYLFHIFACEAVEIASNFSLSTVVCVWLSWDLSTFKWCRMSFLEMLQGFKWFTILFTHTGNVVL